MILFCANAFSLQDCQQEIILAIRMKTLFLKSLIQISKRVISLFVFSLFQECLEIQKPLYSFELKILSILSANLKTVVLLLL